MESDLPSCCDYDSDVFKEQLSRDVSQLSYHNLHIDTTNDRFSIVPPSINQTPTPNIPPQAKQSSATKDLLQGPRHKSPPYSMVAAKMSKQVQIQAKQPKMSSRIFESASKENVPMDTKGGK